MQAVNCVVSREGKFIGENTDGKGSFEVGQTIDGRHNTSSIVATDVDGDGDPDIVTHHSWAENTNGLGDFGELQAFTSGDDAVFPVDIDTDGDIDLITASGERNIVRWHENSDGHGAFVRRDTLTVAANRVGSLIAGDLDGDGDADVVVDSSRLWNGDNMIGWFENMDSEGGFSERKQISQSVSGAGFVHTADLDGDGDRL